MHLALLKSARMLLRALLITSLLVPGATAVAQETGSADSATIHYHRPDGAYEGWGLHVWDGAAEETQWAEPLSPAGADDFGVYWVVPLRAGAQSLGFIIHQGDAKDPGPDMALPVIQNREGWVISSNPTVYFAQPDPTAPPEPAEPVAPPPGDMVSFPGNYGQAIGLPSWAPDDPGVQASDEDGDGAYTLTLELPRGDYEFKVAVNGSWEENYGLNGAPGGDNIPMRVAEGGEVVFRFERATNLVTVTVNGATVVDQSAPVGAQPAATRGDGQFLSDAILHESRSDLYRQPSGAAPFGTEVTLRLRTAANDVEGVSLYFAQLDGDGGGQRQLMRVAGDETHDFWETVLAVGEEPAVLEYAFAIHDGAGTLFYVDDRGDGGAGRVANSPPMRGEGWNIYVYDPAFSAPEWAQNAVIYQIFPDRFRNGDPANDPTADDWFYPDERGHAFPVTPWNRPVPDPEPQDPSANPEWYGTFSSTLYGGDLQGIEQELDYLQSLGVTAIYLNPIFESPSNHRYDARTYRTVDDNLAVPGDGEASIEYFAAFAAAVEERGMHLILDAVPNHVSSDSPLFDRFERHPEVGACEAVDSPTRDYFFFDPAPQAGTGVCAGDTNYRAWFNVATLPQIDTANEEVIEEWAGPDGIVQQWLTLPGVDGFRVDVVPDVVGVNPAFFEFFRDAAKAANPDALLISETWTEDQARSRLLGDEFDTTMNYRFRLALLGFLRDSDFSDNDPTVAALTATQFENALRGIEEDYPPAAFASAMNLISSHDVNRPVRVLDHDGIDFAAQEPVNGFEDGRRRLALAAVLQLTLPGAPTIYYGDEVGLVGFGSDPGRDDPYNRQPYPWADEEGYDDLPEWRQADAGLLAHYQRLGTLRAERSFLRTGSWDTLLVDDAGLYVFGRQDETGAAVIAVNRSAVTQTVAMSLTGYLPFGAQLSDAFSGETAAVGDTGELSFDVGPMGFRIWLTEEGMDLGAPGAPAATVAEGARSVRLSLEAPVEDEVVVYRSALDGGFEEVGTIPPGESGFVDAGLTDGRMVYYRLAARNAAGLEGEPGPTIAAIPHTPIESATLGGPTEISHTISAITPTQPISGVVTIPGATGTADAAPGVLGQLGFAQAGSDAEAFTWVDGAYAGELDGGDVYTATLLPEATGDYAYVWRFSATGGRDWTQTEESGALAVTPSADTEAPKPPFRMDELTRSGSAVSFAWRLSRPRDLHGFRVCRADQTAGETGCATEFVLPRATNVLTDTTVTTGHTYTYTVRVVDTSFNTSSPSAPITLTAELSMVDVTWRVLVPAETPADDTVYIAGDAPEVFGAAYNPGLQPMTKVGDNLWEWTATVKEGQVLLYKYTRGAWETVEQWGSISGLANRRVQIVKGPDNTMLIEDTATDWGAEGPDDRRGVQTWRDPLVREANPAPESAGGVDEVRVTFSVAVQADDPNAVIAVADAAGGPVAGTIVQAGAQEFVWTPAAPLAPGTYTATAAGVRSDTPLRVPYTWSFSVE